MYQLVKAVSPQQRTRTSPIQRVRILDFFESLVVKIAGNKKAIIKITGMLGKQVLPRLLSVANDILKAVPPTKS